jgi:hypothetical protein
VEQHAELQVAAILESAIDNRPESVVLDLSGLDYMGAAGMAAISDAERRLADLGVSVTVRSPSVLINRLPVSTETPEGSRFERRLLPLPGHLGREDTSLTPAVSERLGSSMSSTDPRRITALPADPDLVDGALRLVVELTRSCVSGADGVSVSLFRHGRLSTVAASDQTIMAMDADQYATGEGPCVDASLKGHWFHSESLDTETRWPSFTPRAQALGIKAILSSPLKALGQPVGALNIYSRSAETFEIKDQETAAAFAQKASVILSDAGAGFSETQMAVRYKEALYSRNIITLATGVIMEREGIDEDNAFTALLRVSLHHGRSLRRQAEAIVLSTRQSEPEPSAGSNG